jgi:hypothetical protein
MDTKKIEFKIGNKNLFVDVLKKFNKFQRSSTDALNNSVFSMLYSDRMSLNGLTIGRSFLKKSELLYNDFIDDMSGIIDNNIVIGYLNFNKFVNSFKYLDDQILMSIEYVNNEDDGSMVANRILLSDSNISLYFDCVDIINFKYSYFTDDMFINVIDGVNKSLFFEFDLSQENIQMIFNLISLNNSDIIKFNKNDNNFMVYNDDFEYILCRDQSILENFNNFEKGISTSNFLLIDVDDYKLSIGNNMLLKSVNNNTSIIIAALNYDDYSM